MIIGIPKELKDKETRVGLIPKWVFRLTEQGHTVYIQKGLAEPAGIADEEYINVGAKVLETMEDVYNACEMIVKFKDLMPGDLEMPFRKGQMLFTAFHMAEGTAKPEQVKRLLEAGITGVSYEVTRYPDGSRALTRPMGEIAGRMAPILGTQYIQRQYGGSGVSVVPITGVKRARIVILGGGHAGLSAAQVAEGLGAEVVVFEKSIARLEYLRNILHHTDLRYMDKISFAAEVARADILINCIYSYPGLEVPIVTREMVRTMRKGSVIVDLEGEGIIETAKYTTISDPYFIEEGMTRSFWLVNGEEITTSFACEGAIVFSMDELYYNKMSEEFVETLEDVVAYKISLTDLLRLFQTNIELANWGRVIHQNEYRRLHRSHKDRLTLSAKERYEAFKLQFPQMCQRIQLGYIASYLGITLSTLSRLRAYK